MENRIYRVNIRVSEKIKNYFEGKSKDTGVSQSSLMALALDEYIDQKIMLDFTKKIDFEIMARTIADYGTDIVGLNEMRGEGSNPDYTEQVERLAKLTGMKYFYFAKAIDFPGGPYGNGFLSKIPIVKAETVLIPDPNPKKYDGYYETRCVLKAELERCNGYCNSFRFKSRRAGKCG